MAGRREYRDPETRHSLGRMDIACTHCGALHWLAEATSDSTARNPRFGMCCNHGKVVLPELPQPPQQLKRLLVAADAQATEFRSHITQYNAALAFTSLGVNDDKAINRDGRSGWIFRILGNLYHLSGALTAPAGTAPSYSQLYIYDPSVALQQRMNRNSDLRRDTMQALQDMLSQSHPYTAKYQQAYEVLSQEEGGIQEAEVHLRVIPGQDRRRYNLPTADEVAVIMPGEGEGGVDGRDIILRTRLPNQAPLYRISDRHPAYATLYYVLLFPHGEHGWYPDLRLDEPDKTTPGRLTQSRYYAYRISPRVEEFSCILRGGRLFQQYLVDGYASVDQNRLSYLRHNQRQLRASLYNGLEDAISNRDDNVNLDELGQRFILPSSYIGGPRHMQQRYQDAMAIARYFRKVDLFITVTANPRWPEVTAELFPGQTSFDRPDLVARVFELKKADIIDEIYKYGIFGECAAYVYTIEFQKRGLPHMHMFIFLAREFKLLNPEVCKIIISITLV